MTEAEFKDLITTKKARHVLSALAAIPEQERRAFSSIALSAHKAYEKAHWDSHLHGKRLPPELGKDSDALCVAVLATARPSEYSCGDWRILPHSIPLTEVFRALKLSWVDQWAAAAVEDNPRLIDVVHALFHEGLCNLPETDFYILGYYAHQAAIPDHARDQFLTRDVWRFFEVEGGADLSLAAHDKYTGRAASWADVLTQLSQDGTLDRDRLLDASLDALERDFGQFRAGWHSRFHAGLDPSDAEIQNRVGRYLDLLSSSVPPTVAFALKVLKKIDKAAGLDPAALLSSVEPALQSRQKSTAVMALQLLKSCAKRHPDRAGDVAGLAVSAMISEAGDVQARALDLIESLQQQNTPDIQSRLREYLDLATPTVQGRLAEVLGASTSTPEPQADYLVSEFKRVEPVNSADEAVAVFLELLEDCYDPFLMERAFDGMARFGVSAQGLLTPLAKRADQLRKRVLEGAFSQGRYFERPIFAAALALANGTDFETELQPFFVPRYQGHTPLDLDPNSFEGLFAARAEELLGFIQSGHSVPMLSAPTDNCGYLDPCELVKRLKLYHEIGVSPGFADFKLALMRLGPEGRDLAMQDLQPQSEPERALAYALGADVPPEKDKQLWAIAWSSTLPLRADPRIQELVGKPVPGAGVPIHFEFQADIRHADQYSWPRPKIKVTPPVPKPVDAQLGFAVPAKYEPSFLSDPGNSWMTHPIPWVGLIRPAHSELFFAMGLFELDLEQKLTKHPCLACLDPFFRPNPEPGVMAHAMLVWYLASADGAIGTTATDAVATLVAQQVFDPSAFGDAAHKLALYGGLPLRRWTKRMAEVSTISGQHALSVKAALAVMMVDLPDELPKDLGGVLELLYELCIATGTGPEDPRALSALDKVNAGGKTGKFAKKLAGFGQFVD